jgi:hypothetical protein
LRIRALATKYGIRALPTMVLVDRAGVVVAASHKLDALKPQLDKPLQG